MQDLWRLLEQKKSAVSALKAGFALAKHHYRELKSDSDSSVHRWEWSSSLPRYELDPLYFLNTSSRRGKASTKQPNNIKHKHQYGFDASGRLVVERNHTEFPDQFYEKFFRYDDTSIRSFLYHHNQTKDPINCALLDLDGGIPVSFHVRAQHGSESHVYIPEDERIRYFCSVHMPDGREPFGGCGEASFVSNDLVHLWLAQPNGGRSLAFSGPSSLYNTLAGMALAST